MQLKADKYQSNRIGVRVLPSAPSTPPTVRICNGRLSITSDDITCRHHLGTSIPFFVKRRLLASLKESNYWLCASTIFAYWPIPKLSLWIPLVFEALCISFVLVSMFSSRSVEYVYVATHPFVLQIHAWTIL